MLRALVRELIDILLPPRRSELLLRSLSVSKLKSLEHEDGLPYQDAWVTALVWELKYYKNPRAVALASFLLSERLLAAASEELGAPLLVPVPMHTKRQRERGHNHTEVLCQAALKHLSGAVEYAPHALRRTRFTPTQQGLERSERLSNVEHSMEAQKVHGRACIVVDDVTTTGATLQEAKRALTEAGARSVQLIALARS